MTDKISSTDRSALVSYRLERSEEAFKEADLMASSSFYNAAISRLYYSAYYAAVALLLASGHEASTHAGVKTMVSLHFIRTSKLEQKYGKILQRLFDTRQSGDYDDFIYWDADEYSSLRRQTVEFVDRLKQLINEL